MDKVSGKLTAFFEEPFWVGVFERVSDGELSACKVTFGAEPKDYEIYDFVLKNYYRLRFSPAVATDVKEAGRNPKRVQREVHKQVHNTGVAAHLFCPQLNQIDCHRIKRYNDISI